MGSNLQQRLDDLRNQLQNLPEDMDANAIAQLERAARSLLADAKNTPYEPAAQALFAKRVWLFPSLVSSRGLAAGA